MEEDQESEKENPTEEISAAKAISGGKHLEKLADQGWARAWKAKDQGIQGEEIGVLQANASKPDQRGGRYQVEEGIGSATDGGTRDRVDKETSAYIADLEGGLLGTWKRLNTTFT